jgi:hypothetical protein
MGRACVVHVSCKCLASVLQGRARACKRRQDTLTNMGSLQECKGVLQGFGIGIQSSNSWSNARQTPSAPLAWHATGTCNGHLPVRNGHRRGGLHVGCFSALSQSENFGNSKVDNLMYSLPSPCPRARRACLWVTISQVEHGALKAHAKGRVDRVALCGERRVRVLAQDALAQVEVESELVSV